MASPHNNTSSIIPILASTTLDVLNTSSVAALVLTCSPPWYQESWMRNALNTCRKKAFPVILICWKDSPRCSELMDGLTAVGCILLQPHEIATSTHTQELMKQLWTQEKNKKHTIWGCDPVVRAHIDHLEQKRQPAQMHKNTNPTAAATAKSTVAEVSEYGSWQAGATKHPFLWSNDRATMHVMPTDLHAFIKREHFENCSIKDIMKTYAIQACKEAGIAFDPTKEWALSADDNTPGNSQFDAEQLIRSLSVGDAGSSSGVYEQQGGGGSTPTVGRVDWNVHRKLGYHHFPQQGGGGSIPTVDRVDGNVLRKLVYHHFRQIRNVDGITEHHCDVCTVTYIQSPSQEFAQAMAMRTCPGPKPVDTQNHLPNHDSSTKESTASSSTSNIGLACVVCNKIPAHACKGCNTSVHGVHTVYCSRDCQQSHWKVHKQFCKGAHVFSIPRYCENCRKQTTLGCKVCKMPFCSAKCYSDGELKHKRGCGVIPSPAEMALLMKLPDSTTLPTIKKYNAPLMFIPCAWQSSNAAPNDTSFNVFKLGTDPRPAIREAFPNSTAVQEDVIFLEDYVYMMRLFICTSQSNSNVSAPSAATSKP